MSGEYDPDQRPARIKDIATLDEKLTAEIRRQTCYLLLGLARLASIPGTEQLLKLTADYENACDEADKTAPHK